MNSTRRDYSVFEKFNFENKPVGIKFLLNKPEGLELTDKVMPICRMFKEAQTCSPFYAARDNFVCADIVVLGMADPKPSMASGQIGAREKIYQEARANSRIYRERVMLGKQFANAGIWRYSSNVVFAKQPQHMEVIW